MIKTHIIFFFFFKIFHEREAQNAQSNRARCECEYAVPDCDTSDSDHLVYFRYLSEIELVTLDFTQLVGGVVWLLRDGEVYVDESKDIECSDTEETGLYI